MKHFIMTLAFISSCLFAEASVLGIFETTKNGEGVESVLIEQDNAASPTFDLYGRKVDNPVPGTIYVRDGKKFIKK